MNGAVETLDQHIYLFHAAYLFIIPPENIRKPNTSGFVMFSGGVERDLRHEIELVTCEGFL